MSLPITIAFDITDDVATRAARENWFALGRRTFTPGTLGIIAASTALFALSLRARSGWFWLVLAGSAPVLFVVMLSIWAPGFWLVPRVARRRLARLSHRHVTIQLADDALTIVTANERFELKWIEVRELRDLPHFLVIILAGGAEIPIPREAVSMEARDWLRSKLARK